MNYQIMLVNILAFAVCTTYIWPHLVEMMNDTHEYRDLVPKDTWLILWVVWAAITVVYTIGVTLWWALGGSVA